MFFFVESLFLICDKSSKLNKVKPEKAVVMINYPLLYQDIEIYLDIDTNSFITTDKTVAIP